MKTKLIIFFLTIYGMINSLNVSAQTPNWKWAKSSNGGASGQSVATDAAGNIYVTGFFSGPSIKFGTTTLTNAGKKNVYVVKYNASGSVLWAKSAGGEQSDYGHGISIDATGNIYVTGNFSSRSIVFGSITLTNTGNNDGFIVKYDASGNALWAKCTGGTFHDDGRCVSTDIDGDVYIIGNFSSPSITFGNTVLTNSGKNNIFVVKYNTGGNVIWAKQIGGKLSDFGYSICTDAKRNIYIMGNFSSPSLTFGSHLARISQTGDDNVFVVKCDAFGNPLWAKSIGGSGSDGGRGICCDKEGNVYVTGYFNSPTVDFGRADTLKNAGGDDIFIMKYNTFGIEMWAKSAGGALMDVGEGVSTDASGNAYVTGFFSSPSITFGTTVLTNDGNDNIFVAKYDGSGNVLWAKSAGGKKSDYAHDIATRDAENVYITGDFGSTSISFGTTILNTSTADMFIATIAGLKGANAAKPPKPTAPANLVITDITFDDVKGNNNNILGANENAEIKFKVSNKGKGAAYNLAIQMQDLACIPGIQCSSEQLFCNKLESGEQKIFTIPVYGTLKLKTGKTNFKIQIKEANGFDADPFNLAFQTQEFKNPQLVIADANFTNKDGEGKIQLGSTVDLNLIIQNQGQGDASDVKVKFQNPENVFALDQSEFDLKSLKPNESRKINYEFVANKRYTGQDIPIKIVVTESNGKYGAMQTLKVSLAQSLSKTQQIEITGQQDDQVDITKASLSSDVDKNIPDNNNRNPNRYALIIGNEDYSTYQTGLSSEANVVFARNDAKAFKQYCVKTLGIPEENITYLTDATAGKMSQGIDKMNKLMKNSDGKLEIVFYYAGHGLPDDNTHEPYIIPVDVSGNDLQSAIKLSDIYHSLTQYPSARVTVFFDACFSGGGRNLGLIAARTVKVTPKTNILTGNIVVFSASSGEQTSMPYTKQQHGMFTYFLLKELQATRGDISYQDLSNYLESKVGLESVNINNKEQNPETDASDDIKDVWGNWRMKE